MDLKRGPKTGQGAEAAEAARPRSWVWDGDRPGHPPPALGMCPEVGLWGHFPRAVWGKRASPLPTHPSVCPTIRPCLAAPPNQHATTPIHPPSPKFATLLLTWGLSGGGSSHRGVRATTETCERRGNVPIPSSHSRPGTSPWLWGDPSCAHPSYPEAPRGGHLRPRPCPLAGEAAPHGRPAGLRVFPAAFCVRGGVAAHGEAAWRPAFPTSVLLLLLPPDPRLPGRHFAAPASLALHIMEDRRGGEQRAPACARAPGLGVPKSPPAVPTCEEFARASASWPSCCAPSCPPPSPRGSSCPAAGSCGVPEGPDTCMGTNGVCAHVCGTAGTRGAVCVHTRVRWGCAHVWSRTRTHRWQPARVTRFAPRV